MRGLVLQYCNFSYWKHSRHPVFDLLQQFPRNWCEEDGEISLSLLAHAAMTHGVQRDRDYLAKFYKLIHSYRQVAGEICEDLNIRQSQRYRHTVTPRDPEVAALNTHFQQVIANLSNASWLHYPKIPRKRGMYPNATQMLTRMQNNSEPRLRKLNLGSWVHRVFRRVHVLLHVRNDSLWVPAARHPQPAPPPPIQPPLYLRPPIPAIMISSASTSSQESSEVSSLDIDWDDSSTSVLDATSCVSISSSQDHGKMNQQFENLPHTSQSPLLFTDVSSMDSDSPVSVDEISEREYGILAIVDKRCKKRKLSDGTIRIVSEYLVHWKNFPDPEDETWEPEENLLEDVPKMLAAFNSSL